MVLFHIFTMKKRTKPRLETWSDMNEIDAMIEVLQRVKRCDKAYNLLIQASQNAIFRENNLEDEKKRWLNEGVLKNILDAIALIQGEDIS